MELIILGRYGTFPARNGACPGYLIREENDFVLLECGNGILSRVQKYCKIENLKGIIVSHLHYDHMGDLHILKYALETKVFFGESMYPIPLYIPATPKEEVEALKYKNVFDVRFIDEKTTINISSFIFNFARMQHSIESYAISIECKSKKLVYSGDTTFNEKLIDFAKDANIFLCESTFPNGRLNYREVPHMTALEAADIAKKARVGMLLLTHFWYEINIEECVNLAQTVFPKTLAVTEFESYKDFQELPFDKKVRIK